MTFTLSLFSSRCKQCDMAYMSRVSLFNHVKYVHRKVPYYKKNNS